MIRKTIVAGLFLALSASGLAAQDREERRERRAELTRRIAELSSELSQLQSEQMGLSRLFVSGRESGPFALMIGGKRARMGVVVHTRRDVAVDSIGAMIETVTENAPAAEAGLESGDIIVSFDGELLVGRYPPASDWESEPAIKLVDLVKDHEPGDRVEVVYRRGRETRTTEVELDESDPMSFAYSFSTTDGAEGPLSFSPPSISVGEFSGGPNFQTTLRIIGQFADMELVSLNEELGSYFGTDEGVLVITAPDESFGLNAGDVILKIGGRDIDEPSKAFRIFGSYEPGEEVSIEIMRRQSRETITGTVPERDRNVYWNRRR